MRHEWSTKLSRVNGWRQTSLLVRVMQPNYQRYKYSLSLSFFILLFFLEVALKATWLTNLRRHEAPNKQQKMQRRQEEDNISSGVDRSKRNLSWNMREVLNPFFSPWARVNAVPHPQKPYSLQAISSAKYSKVSSALLLLKPACPTMEVKV